MSPLAHTILPNSTVSRESTGSKGRSRRPRPARPLWRAGLLVLLAALLFAAPGGLSPVHGQASPFSNPAQLAGHTTENLTLSLAATYRSISVYISFEGDANGNNQGALEYREAGGGWKRGMEMVVDRRDTVTNGAMVYPNTFNDQWRSTIPGLSPETEYEVKAIVVDSDGVVGNSFVSGSITTRAETDSLVSSGGSYFVSPLGDDATGDGSETTPWRTIQKAADSVAPGDTVYVRSGIYDESVVITTSGSSDNYITFTTYGTTTVIVSPPGPVASLETSGFATDAGYLRIKGFRIEGGNTGIRIAEDSHDVVVEDNFVTGYAANGYGIRLGGKLSNPGPSNVVSVARVTVQNNTVEPTVRQTDGHAAIESSAHNLGGHVIRYNTVRFQYTGDGSPGSDCIGHNPDSAYSDSFKDTDIYGNLCVGATDDGIELNGNNVNTRVWDNVITGSNSGFSIAASAVGPAYVFRNVVYDLSDHWTRCVGVKEGQGGSGKTFFYHNTFYLRGATCNQRGFTIASSGGGVPAASIVAKNNVSYFAERHISSDSDIEADYSLMFDENRGSLVMYQGFAYYSLESLQGTTELEDEGVYARPVFVDTEAGDFRLAAGSPGIDAGVLIVGINDPDSAWAFAGEAPDIGAFESDGTPPVRRPGSGDDPAPDPGPEPGPTVLVASTPLRINAGGGQVADIRGDIWEGDQLYGPTVAWGYVDAGGDSQSLDGRIDNPTLEIASTLNDEVLATHRQGMDAYAVNLPNGVYDLKLSFAETSYSVADAGQRVFHVVVERITMLENLDVYAQVGFARALVKTMAGVSVEDGVLDVEFVALDGEPLVSGIEVRTVPPAPNQTPIASFTVDPRSVQGQTPVLFDAAGSHDPDGELLSYVWLFGDGTAGEGVTTTHQYLFPGVYKAVLEVTDDRGESSTAEATVAVSVTAVPNDAPVASFFAGPSADGAPLSVTFDASASYDPDGEIVSYVWLFGDGTAGEGATTTHQFPYAGTYGGLLIVTDDLGEIGSAEQSVTVSSPADTGPSLPLRINAGGGETTDLAGNVWQADRPYDQEQEWGYLDGASLDYRADSPELDIADTPDEELFATQRLGSDGYSADLPVGTYDVRLYFAEAAAEIIGAGQRVFQVAIEGATVLNALDVYSEAGFATALVKAVAGVAVRDGVLDIEFVPVAGEPIVSGIEVVGTAAQSPGPIGGPGSPVPAPGAPTPLPGGGGLAVIGPGAALPLEAALDVSPSSLVFGATASRIEFEVVSLDIGTLDWTVFDHPEWVEVSPASGSGGGTVTVTVDRSGLKAGVHKGTIIVTSNGGTKLVTVSVALLSRNASARLEAEPAHVEPGGELVAVVFVDRSLGGVSAGAAQVGFPTGVLELVSAEPGPLLGDGPVVSANRSNPFTGTLEFAAARRGAAPVPTDGGALFEARFRVRDDAMPGTYELELDRITLSDAQSLDLWVSAARSLPFAVIPPIVQGNVNGDESVNYLDLVVLAASFGSSEGDAAFDPRADLDGSGAVGPEDLAVLAANYEPS